MLSRLTLAALLTLASCATEQPTLTTPTALFAQATDIGPTPQPPLPLGVGRYKFRGPVSIILQTGTGSVATPTQTDARKAGQGQGTAAIGDGSTASNASKRSGRPSPWWYVVAAVVGAVLWDYVSLKVGPLKWLPWRTQ